MNRGQEQWLEKTEGTVHSFHLENKGQLLYLVAGDLTNVATKNGLDYDLICKSVISGVKSDLRRAKRIQVKLNSTIALQETSLKH